MEDISKNLIFIDVETPNCRNSSVCQIAIIGNEFMLNEIVNPCVEFDSFNKTFHGIDEIKVLGKPNFKKAFLEKINLLDSKYIFVGHNISFDAHVIVKDALRYGVEIKKLNTICTKKLYEKFFPDCGPYDLKSLCSYFGIELLKHHDAYSDAIACKELFELAIKSNNIKGHINSHIKQMNFHASLNKIKYDSYPQILNLRKALFIQVYSDLKNNKFRLTNLE
ncbi:MAG: exonuclease domain-containing protein [Clostridia bacterium]